MAKGIVHSISISAKRGQLKKEVPQALLIENHGIEHDDHAGDWGRQVTCLSWESLLASNQANGLHMGPGDFAENILTQGVDLSSVGVGGTIKLGKDAVLQVTRIGKEDHPSIVSKTFGVSLLPYEGLFCRVIKGGIVKKGDTIKIQADAPHNVLSPM